MFHISKKQDGFSMIELILVVSIMSILVAILAPKALNIIDLESPFKPARINENKM